MAKKKKAKVSKKKLVKKAKVTKKKLVKKAKVTKKTAKAKTNSKKSGKKKAPVKKILSIHPYLNFDGNCREAMTYYRECFQGRLEMSTYAEAPPEMEMPPSTNDLVMHATLYHDSFTLMACDYPAEMNLYRGQGMSISVQCGSEQSISELFNKLSTGGVVSMPLEDQFWGAKFGMLIDKFGVGWMLHFDKNNK